MRCLRRVITVFRSSNFRPAGTARCASSRFIDSAMGLVQFHGQPECNYLESARIEEQRSA